MTTATKSHLFYQSRQPRPLLDRGEGIYIYDVTGKRYIDGSSGAMVSNIGHSNPRVLDGDAPADGQVHLRLSAAFPDRAVRRPRRGDGAALMPEGLDRVFFVSGGSEAVESAMKLARQYAVAKGDGTAAGRSSRAIPPTMAAPWARWRSPATTR